MGFFNRKKDDVTLKLSKVLVSEVYVCKVSLTSNYDDGSGLGPQCVDFYLLAKLENEKYSELFSGKNLEMEKSDINLKILYLTFLYINTKQLNMQGLFSLEN